MEDANDALIQRFYAAFAARDGDTMAACYAPDATFSDPVFTDLRATSRARCGGCSPAAPTTSSRAASSTAPTGDRGHAHWIARYTFTQTGRKVVNDVHAHFRFRTG